MKKFDKTVPFDPGYSPLTFSFIQAIQSPLQEYKNIKANHQKKFWLIKSEPTILNIIEKSAAFYHGCLLWGSFLSYRFKEAKEITGNSTTEMAEEERKNLDCAFEPKFILEIIGTLDREFKYFLKRPLKVSANIKKILENYVEFAKINDNFLNVKTTQDIKLPKDYETFKKATQKELDELCEQIHACIESGKIERLLNISTLTTND